MRTLRVKQERLDDEYSEAKDLVSFLSENDVSQQTLIRNCLAKNVVLKRRFKIHQGLSVLLGSIGLV